MSTFKAGDIVICVNSGSKGAGWNLDKRYIVDHVSGDIMWPEEGDKGVYVNSLKLVGDNMSDNITDKIKDLNLSADDKLLRQYGVVDDCGNLTDAGTTILRNLLFEANKEAVVKAVKAVDDEEKASKKK